MAAIRDIAQNSNFILIWHTARSVEIYCSCTQMILNPTKQYSCISVKKVHEVKSKWHTCIFPLTNRAQKIHRELEVSQSATTYLLQNNAASNAAQPEFKMIHVSKTVFNKDFFYCKRHICAIFKTPMGRNYNRYE